MKKQSIEKKQKRIIVLIGEQKVIVKNIEFTHDDDLAELLYYNDNYKNYEIIERHDAQKFADELYNNKNLLPLDNEQMNNLLYNLEGVYNDDIVLEFNILQYNKEKVIVNVCDNKADIFITKNLQAKKENTITFVFDDLDTLKKERADIFKNTTDPKSEPLLKLKYKDLLAFEKTLRPAKKEKSEKEIAIIKDNAIKFEKERKERYKKESEKVSNTLTRKNVEYNHTFNDLAYEFENTYRIYTDSTADIKEDMQAEFDNQLYNIARIISTSVINKCIDPKKHKTIEQLEKIKEKDSIYTDNLGYSDVMRQIKIDIINDMAMLERLKTIENDVYENIITESGDIKKVIKDKDLYLQFNKLTRSSIGNGLDLVHSAIVKLLDEIENNEKVSYKDDNFLHNMYEIRRLKKCIRIKNTQANDAYKDEQTCPIIETYREVRRTIERDKKPSANPKDKYMYIEDVEDNGTGKLETIYRRSGRYADITGSECNTTNNELFFNTYDIIDRLKLTDRQALILSYRLQGYGNKAIARHMEISHQGVAKHLKLIQEKFMKLDIVNNESVKKVLRIEKRAEDREIPLTWKEKCELVEKKERERLAEEKERRKALRSGRKKNGYKKYDCVVEKENKISEKEKAINVIENILSSEKEKYKTLLNRDCKRNNDKFLLYYIGNNIYKLEREKMYIELFM